MLKHFGSESKQLVLRADLPLLKGSKTRRGLRNNEADSQLQEMGEVNETQSIESYFDQY